MLQEAFVEYVEAVANGKTISKVYLNLIATRAFYAAMRRDSQYRPRPRKSDSNKPKARKAKWTKGRVKKLPPPLPEIEARYLCNICQRCTYRPSDPIRCFYGAQAWRNLHEKLDRIHELGHHAVWLSEHNGPTMLPPDPEMKFSYPPMTRLPWYISRGHSQGISVWEPTPERDQERHPRRRPPIILSLKEDLDREASGGKGEFEVNINLGMVAASQMHEGTLAFLGETTAKGAGRWAFYYARKLDIENRTVSLIDAHLHEIDRAWKRLTYWQQILVGSRVFDRESFNTIGWMLAISRGKAERKFKETIEMMNRTLPGYHHKIAATYKNYV
jgi:hypothetical protein